MPACSSIAAPGSRSFVPATHDTSSAEAMFRHVLATRIPLVTTSLVVAEVHRFLLHRAGIRPASIAIERISSSPDVRILFPHGDHDREARRWLAKLDEHPITYTDAVSFGVMHAEKLATAMTFDRDFAIAGFGAWRV